MLKSNGNLGLSEAMIAAAKEILEKKLTPKQEKNIDKNHNGKIDAQDFKLLKNKKMQEEEVEHVDEASKSSMAKPKMYSDTMKKAATFNSSNISKMERDEKARKAAMQKEEVEFSDSELEKIAAIAQKQEVE